MKDNKNSLFNFGGAGWGTILYCLLMFYLYVGMVNDGSNALAPAVAEKIGTELGQILTLNGWAGMVAVIGFIIVGQINRKIGPRKTSGIFSIVSGVAYIVCGLATSQAMYFIGMVFVVTGIMSAGYIGGGTLVATWFPKKKGVVMGYTTMGHNLSSASYVALLTGLFAALSLEGGTMVIGGIAILLGIVGILFMRDTPQERGLNPDNVSDEVYNTEYDTNASDDDPTATGGWTTGKLLKTKELWLAAITTGLFQICSVGVMSQLVTRNTRDFGMDITQALTIMTVIALIGVVGSWLVGVIDEKLGTKKTMIGFGLWYAIALVFNFISTDVGLTFYISIFMIGMGIGGSANFTTSLPTSIFGRQGFSKVNSVIFPIQAFVTAWCFVINGVVTNMIGDLKVAYMIFCGAAVLNILLVMLVNEHKYNRDFHVGHEAEVEEAIKNI